ncbi:FAD-binding protein [Cryptosporangium aurantiacum]|uniref:Xylitol oxidase n=1 Tax=Cryptosporangium aurantiacum TaxID=134849 RepID=A0A1M7TUU3_9ACTN|nr:FAD-binding protein [Cryptosporangium aurantiacum]SHN74484.1 xylitol oxidase [Cryptosporangium aurantiacum]
MATAQPLTNWAGNVAFSTATLHRPTSVDEVQEVVAAGERLRVLGTGHSFSTVADTPGALLTVADLPRRIEIDADRRSVTVSAGTRFGELTQVLDPAGWALHNLGSLPHISVGGAVATGTHGSGITNGALAAAVNALEIVVPSGDLKRLERGDADFEGSVVTLGSIGVVTALGLDIQPRYEIEQRVYDRMFLSALRVNLHEVLTSAYSVSVFLTWRRPFAEQVWVKHRTDGGAWPHGRDWLGATLAPSQRNPVPGQDPGFATQQGGVPGPWNARLPHFRLEFTPSAGDELQTEYLLPIENAVPALDVLTGLADRLGPVLHVSEIRTVAADELWLSEAYRQDSVALHFTWLPDPAAVDPVLRALEAGLAPLGARPHWGKVFAMEPAAVAARYPRFADAQQLIRGYDPDGKFRNAFTERYL